VIGSYALDSRVSSNGLYGAWAVWCEVESCGFEVEGEVVGREAGAAGEWASTGTGDFRIGATR
jgi:hypothetical protein